MNEDKLNPLGESVDVAEPEEAQADQGATTPKWWSGLQLEEEETSAEAKQLVRPATPAQTASITQKREPPDFIQTYAQYADVLEAPREMHEAVAVQLLATVLNRNGVVIPLGGLESPLDLWIVLLSVSGGGRSTLIRLADPILQMAGMHDLVLNARWGSPQALYQQLAEHPSGLFVWGELSEKLKLLNDRSFPGTKQWLTDRYDEWRTPEPIIYRATGRKDRDTPPISFPYAPRVNILATSSEEWFFNYLTPEDSSGGFVPRWLLVRVKDSGKVVAVPKRPDPELAETLAILLLYISELKGKPDLSQILGPYREWYGRTRGRFQTQPNQSLAMAYFHRHRAHVIKLAVVFEASCSLSLRVTRASWDRAARMARQVEETIFSLLPMGMSRTGYLASQMVELVRDAGAEGLLLSKFTRAFQHQHPRERHHQLCSLVHGQVLFAFHRQTKGRPAVILVHEDFISTYKQRHPKDVEKILR